MKNVKYFENYSGDKACKADLLIIRRKSGELRLLVKLISPSGMEFGTDGTTVSELNAKNLINEFGAKIEER